MTQFPRKAAEHSAARVAVESEFPHFREEAQAPTETLGDLGRGHGSKPSTTIFAGIHIH